MFVAIIRALIQMGGVQSVIDMVNGIASGQELSPAQRDSVKLAQQGLEDRLDAATGHGQSPAAASQPQIGRRIVG